MSKAICHVLIPWTTEAACGLQCLSFYRNASVREQVTCKNCKKTSHYKNLPNAKKSR